MKKLLALLLAGSLMLTAFAACKTTDDKEDTSSKDDTSSSSKDDDKSDAEDEKEELEFVTLDWYYTGDGPQKDLETVQAELNAVLKEKINAEVNMICLSWGEYEEKMNNKIATGEEFDIAFTCSWRLNYALNATRGAWVELTDEMLDTYAPNAKEKIGADFMEAAKVDGKLYGLQANKDKGTQKGCYYNKDIADEIGLDFSNVKCFDDLIPIFEQVKEAHPEIIPFVAGGGNQAFDVMGYDQISRGVGFLPGHDEIVNVMATQEAYDAISTMRELYLAELSNQDVNNQSSPQEKMKSGEYFLAMDAYTPGKYEMNAKNWGMNLGYCILEDHPVYTTGNALGSLNAISISSKNPERALMFLDLLYSDEEVMNLVTFGIKDTHYVTIDEENKFIEPIADSGYSQAGIQWMYGDQTLVYKLEGEPADKYEQLAAFNAASEPARSLGFTFDISKVQTEVSSVGNVAEEFDLTLKAGAVDVDSTLEVYLEKLEAAGIDAVIEEAQKQYDEFIASK